MSRSDPGGNDPTNSSDSPGDDPGPVETPRSGSKRVLRATAAQAAALSAAVHFLWAWPRVGVSGDPRPYVFLLGGVFTVLIATATLKADEYRRLYALGAGTLSAFLFGYVGWHGTEVIGALAGEPLAIVGKAAEIVGIVAFVALYRLAPPTAVVVERRRREREVDDADRKVGDDERN